MPASRGQPQALDRRPRSAKARNRGQEGRIADASYGDLEDASICFGDAETVKPLQFNGLIGRLGRVRRASQ